MVRFALIGTGSMGKKYAMMFKQGLIENGKLTAVVCRSDNSKVWAENELLNSNEDNTEESDKLNELKIFSSSDELYSEPDLYDAVLIVTPHKTHPELAVKAFELGKAVFCDKPAGISVAQAELMNNAAKKADCLYAMMFHQRLYSKYQRIKELIEIGKIGTVTRAMMINSRYFRTSYYHQSGSWRSSWNGEGGGALINQGQHIVDIWQWLFGMPESVYADVEFGKFNNFKVDDEATLVMRYTNRMTGVFVLTTGDAGYEERLEISGTKGKIVLEDNTLTIYEYSQDSRLYGKNAKCNSREQLVTTTSTEIFEQKQEPYVNMFENFIAAFEGKEKLTAPGENGFNVLQIVNAAYLSAWKQQVIKIPFDSSVYEKMLEEQVIKEHS